MSLFTEDGTRVTATSIQTMTTADPDPLVTIDQDLYKRRLASSGDGNPDGGSIRTLFCRAGEQVRQSALGFLFDSPVVSKVEGVNGAPEGPVAGTNVVTIKGNHLDDVTAVEFDGVAATNLTHVTSFELEVTAPAGTAGPADLTLTGDEGDVTETAAYTYV